MRETQEQGNAANWLFESLHQACFLMRLDGHVTNDPCENTNTLVLDFQISQRAQPSKLRLCSARSYRFRRCR